MGRRGLTLKYIHAFADRTGRMRYYFRRHGCHEKLPGEPGSPEFMLAYTDVFARFANPAPSLSQPAAKGSLRALALAFYSSPQYRNLAPASQSNYRRVLDAFLVVHGHRRADQMRREHVMAIIGGMADRPGAASMLLKRLRTLVRFGLDIGWIREDPTHRVRGYRGRELHTWTEDEIEQFEARWPSGSKQRLAFAILLYTGQRGSDVRRMVWSDIAGAAIRVSQQKTGTKLVIPLHARLQAELAVTARRQVAIMATAFGAAFSVKGFGQFVSDAIRKAGLPARCKAHGLRKAAARRLAEAGCTAKQIAAVTGHKTLAEVERYTRAADQEQLAVDAIEKQEDRERIAAKNGKPEIA